MSNEITNLDDIIDSRDVIARIEELEEMQQAGEDDGDYELTADEQEELLDLKKLASEAEGYIADWQYGETLVRDSYFKEYAQQLAEDCGMIDADAKWPMCCIDWEEATRMLQQDYTSLDFDGVTYWAR